MQLSSCNRGLCVQRPLMVRQVLLHKLQDMLSAPLASAFEPT